MDRDSPTAGLHVVSALRVDGSRRGEALDRVIEETPVAMLYNGISYAVMMATPCDLEDFALGFALGEDVVECAEEFELVDCLRTGHGVSLQALIPQARLDTLERRKRNLAGRSGCGLCGVESLQEAVRPVRRVESRACIETALIRRGLHELAERQPLNRASGGVHAAGYVHAEGIVVREDVGRHNALDKALGARMLAGAAVGEDEVAVLSGRVSFELVQKTAAAGIPVLVAVSAPSSLAVETAERLGVTLAAFVRDGRATLYSHPDRVVG
jgi:formate dehydrogenase accessory protein FdhD